jgi:hypothetical protein
MEAHAGDSVETAVWFMERVCVQLKSDDRPAIIKDIHPDKTAVVELEDHTTQTVRFDEVSRVQLQQEGYVCGDRCSQCWCRRRARLYRWLGCHSERCEQGFQDGGLIFLAKIAGEG